METMSHKIVKYFIHFIPFLILIIYYEIRIINYEKYLIDRSISPKDYVYHNLNDRLNSFSRFGNEYKNFIFSVITRKTQNQNYLKISDQQIQTLKDLNNVFDLELESLSSEFNSWREKQLNIISEEIQRNIQSIQTPAKDECYNRKIFYCKLPEWGFGGQIHSLMTCLLKGYFTRTLVVIDQIFVNYLNESEPKWDQFISPISETCQPNHYVKYEIENPENIIEWNNDITHYLPEEIGLKLIGLHADPKAFWFGQFAKYIMRPNKYIDQILNNASKILELPQIYVGIHIRRGDKVGREARYYDTEQYIFYVYNYYEKLSLRGYSGEKTVFVASDNENIMRELNNKYSDLKFIDKKYFFKNSKVDDKHYSPTNLLHTIFDTYFLSRSDYLICTMSSNICRLSYELMQSIKANSGLNYQSLDLPFHFCCTESPDRVFKYKHTLKLNNKMFDIQVGDVIHPRYDWWALALEGYKTDGSFEGSLMETQSFRFPLYKTIESHIFIKN